MDYLDLMDIEKREYGDSRNKLVKWCQERLRAHKGYSIGIDGIYGTETERVVRQFQRDNGLINDGIIGKNTISILF